jgi:hypothetical protein
MSSAVGAVDLQHTKFDLGLSNRPPTSNAAGTDWVTKFRKRKRGVEARCQGAATWLVSDAAEKGGSVQTLSHIWFGLSGALQWLTQ